jgi:hypothetical protein
VVLGQDSLGPPTQATVVALDEIDDLERLEQLLRRTMTVGTWAELLASEASQ